MSTKSHELDAIQRISEVLFDTTDRDELVKVALHTALEEVHAASGSVLLADLEDQTLVFRHSLGDHPVAPGTRIPWDVGIAGRVFQSGQFALVNDVRTVGHHFSGIDQATGATTESMVTLPLKRWQGAPIGVLNVLNKHEGPFDEHDLGILTVIASFTAVAIHQAQRAEEARLADVARTLGNIGHDLKNLLTPVVSCAGLLKEELEEIFETDPERGELCFEAVNTVLKTSERIRDRVREIADCVKGRSTPLVFQSCQVAEIVTEVFGSLRVMAEEAGVTLAAIGLDTLPIIRADPGRLYTLFYNLVINALAEVQTGGHVVVRADGQTDTEMRIAVIDNGNGMAPEMVNRLFSPGTTSTKPLGTGLGLRIVKDVIDAHGGRIDVQSTLGEGTVFYIHLPIRP